MCPPLCTVCIYLLNDVAGVSMTIPEGAVRQDETVDIYLAVLRDDKDRPKLTGLQQNEIY